MRKISLTLAAAAAFVGLAGCRSPQGPRPKYPPRRPGCELAIFHTPAPNVPAWDDLGPVEVGCHINTAEPQCLDRLRAEACRMGGDILYNMPKKPFRPRDEVMVYRAQVAHSRLPPPKKEAPDEPPAASPAELAGPVVPLGPGAPPPADAGADR